MTTDIEDEDLKKQIERVEDDEETEVEEKSEENDKNILEILYSKYGDSFISEYYENINNWSKWILFSKWKNKNSTNKKVLRSIFPEEIEIDIESKNYEDVKKHMLNLDLKFKIFDSGGKGIHVPIFFSELKNYDESIRPYIKGFIINKLGLGKGDQKKKDNKTLIGAEFYQHRKGQEKKLLFETDNEYYSDNKLWQEVYDYIKTLPEKYEGNLIEGDIKPSIIFKDKKPCDAIMDLVKKGSEHPFRNPRANFIVQQLRDYCGYDINDCFKVLKIYNSNCENPKDEEIISRDLEEQFKRKYNINCNTLIEYGLCKWKRKEDCPKYKYFNGSENKEVGVVNPDFDKAINIFTNKLELAEKFIKIQPVYYERKNQFQVWDFNKYCWIEKDETDILNLISKNTNVNTVTFKEKMEILEALKQVGRKNKPIDIKPTWVQFKNKIYDIETNESFEATPQYFVANHINWNLGDSEETPKIDELIKSWVINEDVIKLYEIIAFTIIPKYFIHSFFFLYAPPGTGKSTFVNLLIKFIGKHNQTATSIDRINYNSRFETKSWHKKLLITMSEVSDVNDLKNSGLINQATGEDPVKAEIKGGSSFEFLNYGKFIYSTNKLLKVDPDDGFGRRVRTIKFINRFEKEQDVLEEIPDWEFENLAKKCLRIAKELWVKRQFTGDVCISERMRNYQELSKTPLENFIDKYCDVTDFEAKTQFDEFYGIFCKFLKEKNDSITKIMLSKNLKKLGFETKNHNWKIEQESLNNNIYYESKSTIFGIKLKEETKNNY